MASFKIEGSMVTVEMYDGTSFTFRSEFARDGKITNDGEFGEELREKIYGQ